MTGYFSCPDFAILIVPCSVVKACMKRPVNPGYRTTTQVVLVDNGKVLSGASHVEKDLCTCLPSHFNIASLKL